MGSCISSTKTSNLKGEKNMTSDITGGTMKIQIPPETQLKNIDENNNKRRPPDTDKQQTGRTGRKFSDTSSNTHQRPEPNEIQRQNNIPQVILPDNLQNKKNNMIKIKKHYSIGSKIINLNQVFIQFEQNKIQKPPQLSQNAEAILKGQLQINMSMTISWKLFKQYQMKGEYPQMKGKMDLRVMN